VPPRATSPSSLVTGPKGIATAIGVGAMLLIGLVAGLVGDESSSNSGKASSHRRRLRVV
jgi:hypothetical protein